MIEKSMSSRQRVLAALEHREPDRVPLDLGSMGPTGISMTAYKKLLPCLDLVEEAEFSDVAGQRARPSENFLRKLRVDARPLRYQAQRSWEMTIQEDAASFYYFDEWGIGRKMPKEGGHTYFVFHHPLEGVETARLARYRWPDPVDPRRVEGLVERAAALRREADPAILLGGSFSMGILQFAAQLEGYERLFCNLVLDPGRIEWILDKILELKLRLYQFVLENLAGWVDIVTESDDFGTQNSQWLSVDMFRRFVKPRYSELFSTLKKRFGVKILFHSCGAVYPLIPEMIEMGVDILNPIQLGAKGMGDTRQLKREFGDALTFWGGGVDVQQVLPYAGPQEIEEEVRRRIEDLSPGGGFVFAATQTIQPDTPPENVLAMWRAWEKYGGEESR